PANRPIERHLARQCALHVNHVFSVYHPERAREILLYQRQPRMQRDRTGLPVLSRFPNLKRLHLRFAVPRQPCSTFFLRGSAKAAIRIMTRIRSIGLRTVHATSFTSGSDHEWLAKPFRVVRYNSVHMDAVLTALAFLPLSVATSDFVGSRACASCHRPQYERQ